MSDIFDKCKSFTTAKEIMAMGCYPYFHKVESGQDPVVIVEGKRMIMMGSNNYLGLTSHPVVKRAAINATEKFGVGCVGSRFLNGTLLMHEELEKRLAKFVGKEAALLFTTGMQVNLGVIGCIVGRDETIITDKYDHASIIDGCSRGKIGESDDQHTSKDCRPDEFDLCRHLCFLLNVKGRNSSFMSRKKRA